MIPLPLLLGAKALAGKALALLARVPWQAWAVLGVLFAGWLWGHHQYARGQAEVQHRWNIEKAEMREALEAARRQGIEAKKRRQAMGRWILTQHQKELADAIAKRDAVIAGLRTGALQLRKHWTCPRVPETGTAAAAGQGDGAADLRAAGAGDLVRIAADADATLRACQRVILADREQ